MGDGAGAGGGDGVTSLGAGFAGADDGVAVGAAADAGGNGFGEAVVSDGGAGGGDGVTSLGAGFAGEDAAGSRLSLYHSRTMKSGSSILFRCILFGLTAESKTSCSFSKNYFLVITFYYIVAHAFTGL